MRRPLRSIVPYACGITRVAATATVVAVCSILCAGVAQANTITVNSLLDDVFPNASGAIFDINGSPITLSASKCTLRMAVASANLDTAVGGVSLGCAAGSGADTIVFDAALDLANTPGTITITNKLMSEAPATFGNTTSALVVSRPLTITGPGSTQLTLDGAIVNPQGMRMLSVADGDDNTDRPFTLTGVRFYRGRTVDTSSGCMFSSESLTLNDVAFEDCESVGGPTNQGFGGALGVGNLLAGTAVPAVSITNSRFLGNRAVRGSSPNRPDNGAAFIGSGTRKVGAVMLTNVLFNGNSAERQGAMLIQNADSVAISGSHFIGNAATGTLVGTNGSGRYGGFLITTVSGNVDINNGTRVIGNVANEERGGFGIQSVGGTVTLDNVEASGNYVNRGRIGGFEVLTDTFDASGNCQGLQLRPVNINNVAVVRNSVATNTGGFRIACSGAVTMTDSYVVGNETRGYRLAPTDTVTTGVSGFQISSATDATAAQSTATLTRVSVLLNSTDATAGGGGNNVASVFGLGAFTADGMQFRDNSVAQFAGLYLHAGGAGRNYLVVNSEFSGNEAQAYAALQIDGDGNYTLRNSTVSGNIGNGAHIVTANANTNTPGGINVAVEHSTIARNTSGTAEAFGVIVFANQPNAGVGSPTLFGGGNAAITVKNSILGPRSPGFTGAHTVSIDGSVTNVTTANSLLEWNGGAPASFCTGAGMKCNVGSLVMPLAYNGGANGIRTMALAAGSPAINAGGAVLGGLTTDQRGTGFPRVIGSAVDMGAFESDPATTVGCTFDLDGNGALDALTDGLVTIRVLFGLTGTGATNGAIGAGATRPDWTTIRNYLNANCGTNFGP